MYEDALKLIYELIEKYDFINSLEFVPFGYMILYFQSGSNQMKKEFGTMTALIQWLETKGK